MPSFTFNSTRNPISGKRERKTISNSSVGLTASAWTVSQPQTGSTKYLSNDKIPTAAVLQVFTDNIYWTVDGTAAAAGAGFEAIPGDFIYLDSYQKIKEFRAIRKTTDAAIEAVYLYGN